MDIETFLKEASSKNIQPYYACYLFFYGQQVIEPKKSNIDYVNWINERHIDFESISKHKYSKKYFHEFIEYLKEYVTKNKTGEKNGTDSIKGVEPMCKL